MKKFTKKQIVLLVLVAVCSALFVFWFVRLLEGIIAIAKTIANPLLDYRFVNIVITLIAFVVIYAFLVGVVIINFKKIHINKLIFIISIVLNSIALIFCILYFIDNLILIIEFITEQFNYLIEHPNLMYELDSLTDEINNLTNETNTSLRLNILFQLTISLFYGIFIGLTISTGERENINTINSHRPNQDN